MNELIEVKTKEDVQVVSARDLHEVLGVKTRFSLWVKQNFKHFRDGIDFTSVQLRRFKIMEVFKLEIYKIMF